MERGDRLLAQVGLLERAVDHLLRADTVTQQERVRRRERGAAECDEQGQEREMAVLVFIATFRDDSAGVTSSARGGRVNRSTRTLVQLRLASV